MYNRLEKEEGYVASKEGLFVPSLFLWLTPCFSLQALTDGDGAELSIPASN
jgi:hypothetical protein